MIPHTLDTLITEFKKLLHAQLALPQHDHKHRPDDQPLPAPKAGAKIALILSPHPDDECLMGALPLRLSREGWQVINVPITLGSNPDRHTQRKEELIHACAHMGFDVAWARPMAFTHITPHTRGHDSASWKEMAQTLAKLIAHYNPVCIFLPHAGDAHQTHIGTHLLALDALNEMPGNFRCALFETEYWHPNPAPNIMVGLDDAMLTTILGALCHHAGEIGRNPYHLRLLPYLADNVRRGSERVGGEGTHAAPMDFAMLYTLSYWQDGAMRASTTRHILGPSEKAERIFS